MAAKHINILGSAAVRDAFLAELVKLSPPELHTVVSYDSSLPQKGLHVQACMLHQIPSAASSAFTDQLQRAAAFRKDTASDIYIAHMCLGSVWHQRL